MHVVSVLCFAKGASTYDFLYHLWMAPKSNHIALMHNNTSNFKHVGHRELKSDMEP